MNEAVSVAADLFSEVGNNPHLVALLVQELVRRGVLSPADVGHIVATVLNNHPESWRDVQVYRKTTYHGMSSGLIQWIGGGYVGGIHSSGGTYILDHPHEDLRELFDSYSEAEEKVLALAGIVHLPEQLREREETADEDITDEETVDE